MKPGRPRCVVEINFTRPNECLDLLRQISSSSNALRENMKQFAHSILEIVSEVRDEGCQTDEISNSSMTYFLKNKSDFQKSFFISNLWTDITNEDQTKLMFMFYSNMNINQQCDLFSFLGNSLNEIVYNATMKKRATIDLTLEDLKVANKVDLYKSCDIRLQCFIDKICALQRSQVENINYKANVYENICKGRNSKYVSEVGVKEHMVVYLSSGKSIHASQVFSKQGAKGTRPVLESILKNSEAVCKFKPQEKSTLFFSYDNIQTLLKSYRIGSEQQKKVIAIVVCSLLCLMPDGENIKSEVQYITENTPAYWYSEYRFDQKNNIFVENLSAETLKNCIKLETEDMEKINEIFKKDLEDAICFVEKDIDENMQDSIDIRSKEYIAKRRKLCEFDHINYNVRSNRTVCDRDNCKGKLRVGVKTSNPEKVNHKNDDKTQDKEQTKADNYLNIENKVRKEKPKEVAVGALPINPNTSDRIARVLDETLDAANMKNQFSVKIVLSDKEVKKVLNTNQEFRKFIVVTADGLPYKVMIDLIRNVHTCAVCGKRLSYIADITDHKNKTQHCEYYQTYGNILPNMGHFHYALTMLR